MSGRTRELAAALVRAIPRSRALIAIILGTAVLFALTQIVDFRTGIPKLRLDPSIESMLPQHDPGRLYFEEVKALFGGGDVFLLAIHSSDVFTASTLESVSRITEQLEDLDFVEHVSSLATALNIREREGELVVEAFFDEVPDDPRALAELRERALADPIYAGNLVSRDGRVTVVMAQLLDLPENELLEIGADEQVVAIAHREVGAEHVWISGGPHVKAEISRLMLVDVLVVVPISWALMALVSLVAFRSVRGVLIPICSVLFSMIFTLAFMAVFYGSLNSITVAVPPILLVVGFAYTVHVLSAYYDAVRDVDHPPESSLAAATHALAHVSVPVIFTGVTTAAGFLSLAASPLGAIRQFGIASAFGIFVTMIVALTFAPAALAATRLPAAVVRRAGPDGFDRILERLARYDLANRTFILTAGAILALISFVGMFRIELGTDMVSNLMPDNPVRLHFEQVNEHLEGANAINVVFESEQSEAFKRPRNLATLERFQAWLAARPDVGGSTSLADYIKVIHEGIAGPSARGRLPDSRELVSQLLIIGANDELERFVDSDYRIANVIVRTSAMDSGDLMDIALAAEAWLAENTPELEARVTGGSVLLARTQDDLAYGQAVSLGLAFLIIYGILVILFTSFRVGAVALIPNALPVLVYFGILGWTGVTLNTVTGLVACLVLGIAVDDTIHLMSRFNDEAKRHGDEGRGVIEAVKSVGRPVTYTTAALCLGFLALTLSEMRSQVEFGLLAAATLAVAWAVDVTFTPAVAARMRVVSLWDLLTLDLGEAPQRSIPLFHGLSHGQARVVAALATIRRARAGEQVIREGDHGDEMYVVIEGTLSASLMQNDGAEPRRVELRKLHRGDVVGEVALFRGRRSADVFAESDAKLLRLTARDLQRLGRRYPRIGAQLYANLSGSLADRLVSLTARVA
jgi:predicted RND superfamily exporter protein